MEIFSDEWFELTKDEKSKSLFAVTSYEKLIVALIDEDKKNITKWSKHIEEIGMTPLIIDNANAAVDSIPKFGLEVAFVISGIKLNSVVGRDIRLKILEFTNDLPFISLIADEADKFIGQMIQSLSESGMEFFVDSFEPTAFLDANFDQQNWRRFLKENILYRTVAINNEVKNRNNFIEIANQLLQQCEEIILVLEDSAEPLPLVDTLFGCLHTLKGGSSFLQPRTLEKFMHKYEDFVNKIRNEEVQLTVDTISLLLKNLDQAKLLVKSFFDGNCIYYTESELQELFSVRSKTISPKEELLEPNQNELKQSQPQLKPNLDLGNKKNDKNLKVPIALLDNLMQISGEQTVLRNMINKLNKTIKLKFDGDEDYGEMYVLLEELHKLNTQIQSQILELRKVPTKEILSSLNRVVRDASKQLGKTIDFKLVGGDIRIDTIVSDVLGNTLIHLVRNSIDHGIESPQEREAKGKSRTGQLTVEVTTDKNNVYVQIRDDGNGLQTEVIKNRAIKNGLLDPIVANEITEKEIWKYIFAPGFSTAEVITDISGRGIGMSAVKESIESTGGHIDIDSVTGMGSVIILIIPVPKSVFITRCLFVNIGNSYYGVMIDNIVRILHLQQNTNKYRLSEFGGSTVLTMNNLTIPVVSMDEILENKKYTLNEHLKYETIIVLQSEKNGHIGIFVDSVFEFEDTVVKEFTDYFKEYSEHFKSINIFYGTSYLGDGSVGLIINVDGIIQARHRQGEVFKIQGATNLLNPQTKQIANLL
jgi:two-component system chemotaxis sensor kinase CheA